MLSVKPSTETCVGVQVAMASAYTGSLVLRRQAGNPPMNADCIGSDAAFAIFAPEPRLL